MAKKKPLKKGASNRKGRRKYFNGGQAYALPTSAAATTSNMMGMGDPAMLQKNLQMTNAMALEQQQRMKAQEDMRTAAAGELSKANLANAQIQAQSTAASSGLALGKEIRSGIQAAKTAGNSIGTGIRSGIQAAGPNAAAGLGGAGLGLAGAGIKHVSNDDDATTMNFGETTGTLMQGAGTGLGLAGTLGLMGAVPGIGWAAAGLGAIGYGAHALVQRNKARVEQEKEDAQNAIARQNMSIAQQQAFDKNFIKQGSDIGYNVGSSMSNSYTPNQQMMYAKNGGMIKRADGSYSKRGLWDNIRANKGSGKEPTKEMLEQEKKIEAQEKRMGGQSVPGGVIKSIGNGAVEFVGKKHSQGGIMLDSKTEVEGGETMDKVAMNKGNQSDYIFSEYLKLGGKSFAKRHKEILKRGGSEAKIQSEVQRLAKMQEEVARRNGEKDRTPEKIMKNGGVKQYQTGNEIPNPYDEYNPYGFGRGESWAYTASTPGAIDYEGTVGGVDYGSLEDTGWSQYYGRGEMLDPEAYKAIEAGGIEKLYDDVYLGRAQAFYQNNPDQAYNWLETMFNSDTPDAEMFRSKLSDADGNMLPKEEALKIAQELSTDRKVGPFHLYLPREIEPLTSVDKPIETSYEHFDVTKGTPPVMPPTPVIPPRGERPPRDLGWMAALPGLLQLGKNDPYPTARTMSPQMQRGVNLPRINMNAERAANAAMNVSTRRQFVNQASGPAGMAASLAANQQARSQGLQIGNQEARTNKDLMAQEAGLNVNIAGRNAAAMNQAGQFNAQMLQQRDFNKHDQDIYNRQHRADVLTGVARDVMAYKSDERFANAVSDSGAYERLTAAERARLKGLVGKEKQIAKKGGYIKRSNTIRSKRRK